jgi:hypothetical protein
LWHTICTTVNYTKCTSDSVVLLLILFHLGLGL